MNDIKNISKTYYKSEIGALEITGSEAGILSILFVDDVAETGVGTPACLQECVTQLDEYFKGERKEFSLKLLPVGSDFQKKAWQQLQKIPYGETISYGLQAEKMGNKKACRAVGGANGKNPLTIVVPCHRVVGQNGTLTGFGAGIPRKEWLLNHEKQHKTK
ncbi:MAG: methylated-DNA--[protein]-cysteine S-methyltransferase [Candidatus Aminicenantes bacterium]|nr:methylated-DNA--[protein]-cysteine S-methyltransferase [Candidatus Aminicenantes bacterium]